MQCGGYGSSVISRAGEDNKWQSGDEQSGEGVERINFENEKRLPKGGLFCSLTQPTTGYLG
jgi:hypothetical protein